METVDVLGLSDDETSFCIANRNIITSGNAVVMNYNNNTHIADASNAENDSQVRESRAVHRIIEQGIPRPGLHGPRSKPIRNELTRNECSTDLSSLSKAVLLEYIQKLNSRMAKLTQLCTIKSTCKSNISIMLFINDI